MPYTPPWLNVQPSDFVQAAQGGARIGTELADQANQAGISARNNATALEEAQMRANTEAAAQQAAGERAQQEAAIRRWELTQQIAHQQNQIAAENERNQNTIAGENTRAASSLAAMAPYHAGMLSARDEQNRIAQEREEREKAKADAPPPITAHLPGKPASTSYDITDPGVKRSLWFDTAPSSLSTTNVADLSGLPARDKIVTNTTPAIPALTYRLPPGQSPGEIPPIGAPAAPTSTPQAMGGYKVGATYKGMTYLGGDPNDPSSWNQ